MVAKPAPRKAPARKAPVVHRPILQWITAGLGLVLTLSAIGVIVLEALKPGTPPAFSLRVVEALPASGGWVAEVEVANAGSQAAGGVEVEGVQAQTTAGATLDYVAANGRATVFLAFPDDPRAAPPSLSVTGWAEP